MKLNFYCRRVLSIYLIMFFWLIKIYAQDPNGGNTSMLYNNTAVPSNGGKSSTGTGASLGVDLYTGRLQAGLPIYTLQSTDLKIPISIDYTAGGGVRTQDINTPVGLGWTLNAGGQISRTVRGLPDESPYGYIGTYNEGVNLVNYFNNRNSTVTVYNSFNNSYVETDAQSDPNALDGEPDIFDIQTPYFNLKFTIDQNGKIVTQGNTGFKITHSLYKNSSNAINTGIVVTDDQGTQYFFGSSSASRETATTNFFGQSFTYNSTWYLDKIVTYNSKDIVSLSYMQGSSYTVYSYGLSKAYNSTFSPYTVFPPTSLPSSYSSITTMDGMTSSIVYNQPKYVSQIIAKQGEADFTYTYNANQYINTSNPPELTSITIKQYGASATVSTIRTFGLNYLEVENGISGWTQPYAYNDIWSDYYRRLLQKITVSGSSITTSIPQVLFNLKYNQDHIFPDRGASPQNCDYWGYVNNLAFSPDANNSDAPFFTNPDAVRVPSFYNNYINNVPGPEIPTCSLLSLTEVDNLMGESAIINYESNTYFDGTANQSAGGCRVYNITHKLPTGEQLFTNYIYNDQNGNSTGQLYSDFYKRVRFFIDADYSNGVNVGTIAFSQSPFNIADDNGVYLGYSSVRVQSQNGGYELNKFTNFSDYPDLISSPSLFLDENTSYINDAGTNWGTNINGTVSSFAYKRGLLKSKATYTNANIEVSETDYTYGSLDQSPIIAVIGAENITWGFSIGSNQYFSGLTPTLLLYNSNIENWRLKQKIEKYFDQLTPANSLTTTTNYTYDPVNERLLQGVSTTDSKGLSYTQTIYHADDIASTPPSAWMVTPSESGSITSMVNSNRTNIVIHSIENRNGTVNQTHYSYATSTVNNNVYLSQSSLYTSDLANTSNTLVKQESNTYDPISSNLISTNALGGVSTSILYGYNSSLPIAKIVDASSAFTGTTQSSSYSNEFFYEGFEQIGNVSGVAHTGNESYSGTYVVPFSLPNNRSYLIQWWSYTGGVWVFNQQPYTGPISLSGQIDDVRIFPKDALMTTYTYSPLVGKTSETDPSGRSQTFEYDGLGRISIIRDNDRNILKKYCYSYSGQPLACTATVNLTYTNSILSNIWIVNLTNIQTGQVFTFSINTATSGNGQTFGQVPTGTYNVTVTTNDASTSRGLYFGGIYFGNSYTSSGPINTFFLNNATVSANTNLYISF
jgi:YD repeat-containing protein